MAKFTAALCLATGSLPAFRAEVSAEKANPIRRVVNMLQSMQTKVTAEGKQEEELYNKFNCYCQNNKGALGDTISAAETKGPAVASSIEQSEGEKEQLDADLKAHRADREAAKSSIAGANALREKEASAFAASSTELGSNIGALGKAVTALEKGMAGGFLQTSAAHTVRKVVESLVGPQMIDVERQAVLSFLSGGSDYSPQSGQITGILKQLHDEMSASLADETAAEKASIEEHSSLVGAKSKEIAAHTKAIEEKTVRAGEVAVSIVNQKQDLKDTQEALEKDKAFLAELEQGCGTKEAEYNEHQKTRSAELVALSETIAFLNNDDALELFKKAVPQQNSQSFMQLSASIAQVRSRALAEVRTAQKEATHGVPALELIALALRGKSKTGGFEKVTAMIDEMVQVLADEQKGDDKKKEYCEFELDKADDKKKGLEKTISDQEMAAASAQDGIDTLTAELQALADGIAKLDKSVADATELRKEEHADHTELMAMDTQAKDILAVAKNRLNKFYNPKLYIEPKKKELTRAEAIEQTVVPAFVSVKPPPPPETADYAKSSQESSGVIAMIDMLVADLDKEMQESETSEKDAQADYEKMLADAKAKRAADSTSVSQKEGSKADLEEELQSHKDGKAASTKELMATAEYISGLHGECDWLAQNFDARKAARAGEVESLKNAKAVLAGADYSLVQLHDTRQLRGRA